MKCYYLSGHRQASRRLKCLGRISIVGAERVRLNGLELFWNGISDNGIRLSQRTRREFFGQCDWLG